MLKACQPSLTEEDVAAAASVLRSGELEAGEHVDRLVSTLAAFLSVPPAWILLTNSASTALACLGPLLSPGVVVAPALTWPATYDWSSPDHRILADTDTLGHLSIPALYLRGIGRRSLAVPVALWGRTLDEREVGEYHRRCDYVAIDAAHDLNPIYMEFLDRGIAEVVVYSFGPLKEVCGVFGGALVSPLAYQLRAYVNHGVVNRVPVEPIGVRGRMSDVSAAVVSNQLKRLTDTRWHRSTLLGAYQDGLGSAMLTTPEASGHLAVMQCRDSYHRVRVIGKLREAEVETAVHYPLPFYLYPLPPVSAHLADTVLTLPCHAAVTVEDVRRVCATVNAV